MAKPMIAPDSQTGRGIRSASNETTAAAPTTNPLPTTTQTRSALDLEEFGDNSYRSVKSGKSTVASNTKRKNRGNRRRRDFRAPAEHAQKTFSLTPARPAKSLAKQTPLDEFGDANESSSISTSTAGRLIKRKKAQLLTRPLFLLVFMVWPIIAVFAVIYAGSFELGDTWLVSIIGNVTEAVLGTNLAELWQQGVLGILVMSVWLLIGVCLSYHYMPGININSLGGEKSSIKLLLLVLVFIGPFIPVIGILPFIVLWLWYAAYYPD